MLRRQNDGKNCSSKNNLTQDSKRNEEKGYSAKDFNKTKINDTKEPNHVHKNTHKEEILQVINENFMDITRHF
jgi:hypothetical protein